MSKILILAQSGFGKSTSIGNVPALGIKGLNPKETFIITATSKPLPFKGSTNLYPVVPEGQPPQTGNRYISNEGTTIARVIRFITDNRPDIKNIVFDDVNYVMQDYYMENSKAKGYDTFKEIGASMHMIFSASEYADERGKNIIMMAHFEEYKDSNLETLSYRFKTVGKMVQDYITPEGKFEIVLFGKQFVDPQTKEVTKQFVTNFDGQYPAKSPSGMFEEKYILNDLGQVIEKVDEYYK